MVLVAESEPNPVYTSETQPPSELHPQLQQQIQPEQELVLESQPEQESNPRTQQQRQTEHFELEADARNENNIGSLRSRHAARARFFCCFIFYVLDIYAAVLMASYFGGSYPKADGMDPLLAGGICASMIIIAVILISSPIAFSVRKCYHQNPIKTVNGCFLFFGIPCSAFFGGFAGFFPFFSYVTPQHGNLLSIVWGLPLSIYASFWYACNKKTLVLHNEWRNFRRLQILFAFPLLGVYSFIAYNFDLANSRDRTSTAIVSLIVTTTMCEALFLSASLMVYYNIIVLIHAMGNFWPVVGTLFFVILVTVIIVCLPLFVTFIYKTSELFVDSLILVYGESEWMKVLVYGPNDNDDQVAV